MSVFRGKADIGDHNVMSRNPKKAAPFKVQLSLPENCTTLIRKKYFGAVGADTRRYWDIGCAVVSV